MSPETWSVFNEYLWAFKNRYFTLQGQVLMCYHEWKPLERALPFAEPSLQS